MPSRAHLKGAEIVEEERQMQLQNEAAERAAERDKIAVELAKEQYGSDDVVIEHPPGGEVEYVDGGYWVRAEVWVSADDVEERMDRA